MMHLVRMACFLPADVELTSCLTVVERAITSLRIPPHHTDPRSAFNGGEEGSRLERQI